MGKHWEEMNILCHLFSWSSTIESVSSRWRWIKWIYRLFLSFPCSGAEPVLDRYLPELPELQLLRFFKSHGALLETHSLQFVSWEDYPVVLRLSGLYNPRFLSGSIPYTLRVRYVNKLSFSHCILHYWHSVHLKYPCRN